MWLGYRFLWLWLRIIQRNESKSNLSISRKSNRQGWKVSCLASWFHTVGTIQFHFRLIQNCWESGLIAILIMWKCWPSKHHGPHQMILAENQFDGVWMIFWTSDQWSNLFLVFIPYVPLWVLILHSHGQIWVTLPKKNASLHFGSACPTAKCVYCEHLEVYHWAMLAAEPSRLAS